ncbi:hypothetical protein MMC10_010848 [Thelotrema lepadinum]|nr:hypothetical protein [Thelotrema lepadinum]
MESKAPSSTFCLHTETRLSLEPYASSAIVQLQLPSTSAFSRSSRIQRRVLDVLPAGRTEEEFKTRDIASSSSIYFRSANRYPRNVLWRCVENNRTLELRSLDLNKAEDESREARIVLRVGFPSAIHNHGVAISDSPEEDLVVVFVLTSSNDLYTLSLRPSFFCKLTASEDDSDRWCKLFRPSSLSISSFYRLSACGPYEILLALGDGRLVNLTRRQGDDGSTWNETAYNDGQWGSSLKSLIRWQGSNTIRYEGNVLDQQTLVNTMLSPDKCHVLAVAMNHTLKFWNLETGVRTVSKDLLDIRREPQDTPRFMLNPAISKVLTVFETQSAYDGDLYYALTFSPHSSGVFKVWGVRDADHAESGVRDLFSDDVLRAPDPDDGALWTMLDFQIKCDSLNAGLDIWILLRLNRRYKLYHRQFSELRALGNEWQYGWSATAIDVARHEPLNVSDLDCESTSDAWLNFLTTPGRIPENILETALQAYIDAREVPRPQNNRIPLKERIAATVGSRVYLRDNEELTSSSFQTALRKEWASFWNTVMEIEHMQWDPLSLALDSYSDMPYIVFADGCSIVREFSEIESLAYNKPKDLIRNQSRSLIQSIEMDGSSAMSASPEELSTIIDAAARFRSGFSPALLLSCQHVLRAELWLDSSYSAAERIQAFYDQCNFDAEIGDRTYNNLAAHLKSIRGFNALTTDALLSIVEMLPRDLSEASGLSSTLFGLKALVKGTHDLVVLHLRVLSDLLYLLVFAEVEVDREEYSMENLDSSMVFSELLEQLRQNQLAYWLSTHTRPVTNAGMENTTTNNNSSNNLHIHQSTVIESLFARDIKPQASISQSQSFCFTQTMRDVLTWMSGAGQITFDKVLVNIQCYLLKNHDVELASSFAQFQPSTAWASYIHGRLSLEKQEYTEAVYYFKKAAFKLCKYSLYTNGTRESNNSLQARPIPPSSEYTMASSDLLDPLTASFLASGLPNYYTHVINLLSPHRTHTHISSFAQLALQHITPQTSTPDQRTDLLARLFHASLAISDYATAYSALTRHTDSALHKSSLSNLITTMISAGYVSDFLAFPFPGPLQKSVDNLLAEHAAKETNLPPSAMPSIPYFKILHAFRLQRGDYRGAATVLVERLEARHERKAALNMARFGGARGEAERALDEYLVGINALSLLKSGDGYDEEEDEEGDEDAWVFVEGTDGVGSGMGGRGEGMEGRPKKKRRVMRLDGLRERYQDEMDRVGVLEMGRWGIVGEGDGEVEVEVEGEAMEI